VLPKYVDGEILLLRLILLKEP